MNPLMSIKGTIITGVVLSIIFLLFMGGGGINLLEIEVWLHVLSGVTWVGLLYYFNFIQVPSVAKALSEVDNGGPGAAAINKYIAPKALVWFRWGAVATWVTGVAALESLGNGGALAAFTLQNGLHVIGVGAWLGTIMFFNVWVLIWPNQKKILGLDGQEHSAGEIAAAKKIALLASRINTALSIPMLMFMTGHMHGMPF